MLEPSYGIGVEEILDKVENDDSRSALWNEIVARLTMICDEPGHYRVRERRIVTPGGETVWLTILRVPSETDNWGVLWQLQGDEAVIVYVGPWPPV